MASGPITELSVTCGTCRFIVWPCTKSGITRHAAPVKISRIENITGAFVRVSFAAVPNAHPHVLLDVTVG